MIKLLLLLLLLPLLLRCLPLLSHKQPQLMSEEADVKKSKKHLKQNGAAADIAKLAEEAAAKAARYHARMAATAAAAKSTQGVVPAALVDDLIADADDDEDSGDSDDDENDELEGQFSRNAAEVKQHIYNTGALWIDLEHHRTLLCVAGCNAGMTKHLELAAGARPALKGHPEWARFIAQPEVASPAQPEVAIAQAQHSLR